MVRQRSIHGSNANQTLQISAQIFNTADVGDSITMRQFIVEEMGN